MLGLFCEGPNGAFDLLEPTSEINDNQLSLECVKREMYDEKYELATSQVGERYIAMLMRHRHVH